MADRVEVEFSGGATVLAQGASAGSALTDPADRTNRVLGRVARGNQDTLLGGGRLVAPGAGVAIANSGAANGGRVYEIFVAVSIGPGGLAADDGNVQLQEGATVLCVLAAGVGGPCVFGPIRRSNVGGAAYTVNAVAAATAGVPYTATISATRVE